MSDFRVVSPDSLTDNTFSLIGKDWMLITAGTEAHCNTMTASWGGFGILWCKPVAFVFVRPQRYTYEFMATEDTFSLSFLPDSYRDALQFCGTHSGRDGDKFAQTGLTVATEDGVPYVAQARMVIICKKCYAGDLLPECFTDASVLASYTEKDYHCQFIGSIEKVMVK